MKTVEEQEAITWNKIVNKLNDSNIIGIKLRDIMGMILDWGDTQIKGTNFEDIINFHEKNHLLKMREPGFISRDIMAFRLKFLEEELCEIKNAYEKKDLEGFFDGLIDLVYVVLGTSYLSNLPWQKGWEEVHKCNMKKERATHPEQSKRNSTFDIVKPTGWKKPDLKKIINNG